MCSVCSESFQRQDINDFIEHMATHEAADIIWTIRGEELAGTYDNTPSEVVELTPEEWEIYLDGRENQLTKELREVNEYELQVKTRQRRSKNPLPKVVNTSPVKGDPSLPKVIMPSNSTFIQFLTLK